MAADLDPLIQHITGLQRRIAQLESRLDSWATVTALAPLRVRLDGEASALDITPVDLVGNLAVGARVRVEISQAGCMVVAKPAATTGRSGWTNLTPLTGAGTCRYRVSSANLLAELQVELTGASVPVSVSGSSTELLPTGSLPSGARPSGWATARANTAGSGFIDVAAFSNGSVRAYNTSTGTVSVLRFNLTYAAN